MFEVSTNVFVGRVGSRVRDELWERVKKECKDGRATMVYGTNNEQRFDFRVHNSEWEPIDFDGLKLMLRPDQNNRSENSLAPGYSKASRYLAAKQFSYSESWPSDALSNYVVINIETTGLSPSKNDIIAMSSIAVKDGAIYNTFSVLLYTDTVLSSKVTELTGIANEDIKKNGERPECVLAKFIDFIGDSIVISHNSRFDFDFIAFACAKFGLNVPDNDRIDIMQLSKKYLYNLRSYSLSSLAEYFHIDVHTDADNSISDCYTIASIYERLKTV
jgi:CRISPR-associated protein Cas2